MRQPILLAALVAALAAPVSAAPPFKGAVVEPGFEVEGAVVRLVWQAPETKATGFQVERRNPQGVFEPLHAALVSETSFDVTSSLLPDRTNVFRVVAVVAGKSLAPSHEVTFRFVRPRRALLRHPSSDLPSGAPGALVTFGEAPGASSGAVAPAPPPALPVGVQPVPVVVQPEQPASPRSERRIIVPVADPPPVLGSSPPPPAPPAPAVAPAAAPPAAPPSKADEPKRGD